MSDPLPDLDPETNPTITVAQLAAVLNVDRNTAYRAIESGDLPHVRVGRAIRIPTAAVRAMLGLDQAPMEVA